MNFNIALEKDPVLHQVIDAYPFPETLIGITRYGCGHINDTYCLISQPKEGECIRFILQGLSSVAFPEPEKVMENFLAITDYLRDRILEKGGDAARETLSLVYTKDGKPWYTDENGKVWRLMPFVEGTDCLQFATPELFEASARTFGNFQKMLVDFPAHTLHETIRNFHNTPDRFQKLLAAIQADKVGRAASVQEEIAFALSREEDCKALEKAHAEGKLPLRVTHNDTKLNNILIDKATQQGLCVIDLDTTMPGFSVNDFGDSIRFGANNNVEDEPDLSKVNFDIALYEAYTRGFLEGADGILTEGELEYLPWGARLMTLECGIRFLTDYLDGDNYFRTRYPEHNLNRCHTQFKLVQDMEAQFHQMQDIVKKYSK